ncbi:MAG: beta-glucosidase [Acidiferrobacterales bacterium]|nr:beta-glucosidase [Acidiferrobacterales bacterium]
MALSGRIPGDFIWGAATSAYQIEGAADIDGRGPSIWDVFCQIDGKTNNRECGKVACDHYHRMEEDVKLMANMGVDAYRFSISWSRVLSDGTTDSLNMAGIDFYSRLIDTLIDNDITPWVTLYHWDLPQHLQSEYQGWMSEKVVDMFADYASVCFEHFGDRVKHWITINEAWVVSILGHGQGVFAPGHISNSEPYQVGHNLLIAHAKAVQAYRTNYQKKQGGIIGITNNCDWREPLTDSPQDKAAAQRALEFFLGWFADPIYLGDYPECMKLSVGDRLAKFSDEEKDLIEGSSDFFGLNHYTTMYASDSSGKSVAQNVFGNGGLSEDQGVSLSIDPEWQLTDMQWAVVPWGCRKLLNWISERYDNPDIYITENGCAYDDELVDGSVNDERRIEFFESYLSECANAIEDGVNLKGFFVWSLLDNFEWALGYDKRFGIHHVDFETGNRTAKESAKWIGNLIKSCK